ncbi:MAG TPA: hypothetical protein VGF85_02305 [Opitutaceae bacterium]
MSILRRTLSGVLFLLVAGVAAAATPSKQEVLLAISTLEKSLSGPEAEEAAKTVVIYAQQSDDVMVDIGPEQIPWVAERWGLDKAHEQNNQSMLLACFVAGNMRTQLKAAKAEDDTYSGWLFAIEAYRRLREKSAFSSPAIENLRKMQEDGTLQQHAKDVEFKDEQEEGEPSRPPMV